MAIHTVKGVTILTQFVQPPIPDRQFDWSAVIDGEYDCDCDQDGFFSTSMIGYGEDEQAAIDDLLHLIDESGEAEPDDVDRQASKFDHDRDMRKNS